MQATAALVETWLNQRRPGAVARVIAADGLGPRARDDVLLVDPAGRTGGSLLGGAVNAEVMGFARWLLEDGRPHTVVSVDIDPADAAACGLVCGGRVELLVQRLDVIPMQLWATLSAGRPAALVTALGTTSPPMVVLLDRETMGTLANSGLDTLAQAEAEAMLALPGSTTSRVPVGRVELVIEAWNPVPRLLVVGASALSEALTHQVGLLGWSATTVVRVDDALAAVEKLTQADIVIVLEHDPFVATPVLEAALRRHIGYVGALGSRRTQEQRRTLLADQGVRTIDIDRLHGPVGLDIGARTPSETAISITAEIVAVRSNRSGAPLTTTTTRIRG
jgi:xanthine dehydrogenase accessory factor